MRMEGLVLTWASHLPYREWAAAAMVAPLNRHRSMAEHVIPHFHNDLGVSRITIGTKKFMCMGARPPLDHPHIFIDMGDDAEAVCSYCSTLYVHDPRLGPRQADPPECAMVDAPV
jgi:uncharacterized Zn-finger protein